jgi:formate hydrogenlyase subunit 3/multisubunit Na+/H+ antiporter MnhD subunit
MLIILVSPIALYLTALMLIFLVFGADRRTFQASLFLLGFIVLITAAAVAMVAGNEADALQRQGKDPARVAQALALRHALFIAQAVAWPAFAAALILTWRHRHRPVA